jgi:hypothetical protein
MPRFLDVHSFSKINQSVIRNLQGAPPDEFGVRQLNVLYNGAADLCFCFLEAPNRESVEKHMKNTILSAIGSQRYKR